MSFTQDFIKKYQGKDIGFPTVNDYKNECLSLVKVYIQERYGIYPPASGCNAARCYWSLFPDPLGTVMRLVSNTADVIPKEGWIPVWNGNVGAGDGHISIVSDNNATLSRFNSFDANWGGKQAHIVDHDYNNVEGFLVPKEENMSTELNACMADRLKFWRERDEALEKLKLEVQAHKKTVTQLDEAKQDIARLNNELESCSEVTIDPELWAMNGLTVEITEGNKKQITNYKLKN